ncbi:hypothetical protein DFH09DRAFT_1093992 [Mycena vulgaris]|nr:hypothetical protein DFH09DRAFT_1093992 [Mycena vulgaris]
MPPGRGKKGPPEEVVRAANGRQGLKIFDIENERARRQGYTMRSTPGEYPLLVCERPQGAAFAMKNIVCKISREEGRSPLVGQSFHGLVMRVDCVRICAFNPKRGARSVARQWDTEAQHAGRENGDLNNQGVLGMVARRRVSTAAADEETDDAPITAKKERCAGPPSIEIAHRRRVGWVNLLRETTTGGECGGRWESPVRGAAARGTGENIRDAGAQDGKPDGEEVERDDEKAVRAPRTWRFRLRRLGAASAETIGRDDGRARCAVGRARERRWGMDSTPSGEDAYVRDRCGTGSTSARMDGVVDRGGAKGKWRLDASSRRQHILVSARTSSSNLMANAFDCGVLAAASFPPPFPEICSLSHHRGFSSSHRTLLSSSAGQNALQTCQQLVNIKTVFLIGLDYLSVDPLNQLDSTPENNSETHQRRPPIAVYLDRPEICRHAGTQVHDRILVSTQQAKGGFIEDRAGPVTVDSLWVPSIGAAYTKGEKVRCENFWKKMYNQSSQDFLLHAVDEDAPTSIDEGHAQGRPGPLP